ncbi:MAG: hypothetical protein WCL18_02200 [bacterium]
MKTDLFLIFIAIVVTMALALLLSTSTIVIELSKTIPLSVPFCMCILTIWAFVLLFSTKFLYAPKNITLKNVLINVGLGVQIISTASLLINAHLIGSTMRGCTIGIIVFTFMVIVFRLECDYVEVTTKTSMNNIMTIVVGMVGLFCIGLTSWIGQSVYLLDKQIWIPFSFFFISNYLASFVFFRQYDAFKPPFV